MSAIVFIIETLLSLAMFAVLARLLLQWCRADFRNPIAQAIVRATNPVIVPLRRIVPPIGRIDTASVVVLLILAVIATGAAFWLRGLPWPSPDLLLKEMALKVAIMTLWTYFYAIFLYAILSMIAPGGYSPLQSILGSLCEPVLRPFRRLIPSISGLDLSPLWAGIAIQAVLILLR